MRGIGHALDWHSECDAPRNTVLGHDRFGDDIYDDLAEVNFLCPQMASGARFFSSSPVEPVSTARI